MGLWLWCSRFLMCGWKSWSAWTHVGVASMPLGYYEPHSVCLCLPSPVLEVPKSKSSLVTFWESRYVAGTQPCSSAVLTNHQPGESEAEPNSVNVSTANYCTSQDGWFLSPQRWLDISDCYLANQTQLLNFNKKVYPRQRIQPVYLLDGPAHLR